MNEAETRAELIDPLLVAAGWGVVEGSRIRREFPIAPGRIEGGGRRGKSLSAGYVLSYRNTALAVVEAKADTLPLTEGVGQAKEYAAKLQLRFTYASNGKGIYAIDRETGEEGEAEAFPTPQELWARTFAEENAWRDRFAAIPYPDKGGSWQIRFYQEIAVKRVLEAIASGRNRILLTLATGTGKTSIAVLAHVAYALQPIPREERAAHARLYIHSKCTSKQQLFLNFVLQHYVTLGVQELALDKLTPLLQLRYQNSIADAVADLGRPEEISQLFAGFQRYLYEPSA
jgi:hypothetical protein